MVVRVLVFFRHALLPLVVVPIFFRWLGNLLTGKWSLPFEAVFVEAFNDFLLL